MEMIHNIIEMKSALWELKRTFVKEGKAILRQLCEHRDYLQHYDGMLHDWEWLFKRNGGEKANLSMLDRNEEERCEREQCVLESFSRLLDDFKRDFERECGKMTNALWKYKQVLACYEADMKDSINDEQKKSHRYASNIESERRTI